MATTPTELKTGPESVGPQSVGLQSVGLPDAEYFDVMASFARRHWWYTSRRALARDTLARLGGVGGVAVDLVALREYARVVAPGGTVLLTVPAYQWMWSEHDVRACHRRRYTAARLARTVESAGITVLRTTYYHSFLLPAAVILRKSPLRRLVRVTDEQTSYLHPAVNRIFALIARCEGWLASHVRIPFGLSIMLVGTVDRQPGGRRLNRLKA
jgi:hypothetical protein